MARIIEVVVSPKGETTLQTKGYVGSACLLASKFLEDALGIKTGDQKNADYYQTNPVEQSIQA